MSDERAFRELLQSVVDVARAIFAAQGATVFLYDAATDELVFEAVSGVGDQLVGTRLPSSTGIAGWVLLSGQPLVIEDAAADPRFAREVGEAAGYTPKGLMAVPLLRDDDAVGVLEVLDRPRRPDFSLGEVELLSMFGAQAAIAIDLLLRARAERQAEETGDAAALVGRIAAHAGSGTDKARRETLELLAAVERVLARARGVP
jgi:GAF domain-containing protein